jgi:hypothetical protein
VAIGRLVAHLATVLRQHWLMLLLASVVAFFLCGGALALTSRTIGGVVPTGESTGLLAEVTVAGWKDLLTTLPPVDGDGQFLVLPYLLGLAGGVGTFALARRTHRPALPIVVPVGVLVLVVLIGTAEPAGLLLHGVVFPLVALLWVVVRRRRVLRVVGTGSSSRSQALIAAGLIAASAGAAYLTQGSLPGVAGVSRVVLRTYVEPPFDITQYPSPLVGFRKYTEGAAVLWDQELLTVTGLGSGERLRMAVLDDYSGTVWSAGSVSSSGGFHKVGPTIGATQIGSGEPVTVTITISAALAGKVDANTWVPSPGYASAIVFSGPRARALAEQLRYNTATGQAVVPTRFAAADVVRVTAVPVPLAPKDFQPAGAVTVAADAGDFLTTVATKWGGQAATPWEQLAAVARTMQSTGAYSDGMRKGEEKFLPGHGVARLGAFVTRPQIVGNDEQYAATFALIAGELGVPARVVLGAVVPADGVVRGRDVHAWVEVQSATGQWYAVPTQTFMPDRTKLPDQVPQTVAPDANAADVPPPNAQRPPGTLDTTFDTDPNARVNRAVSTMAETPQWILAVLTYVGLPITAVVSFAALLALARSVRRRRRAGRGPAYRRFALGWRDYVDHARDLGFTIPSGLTRSEQATLVGCPDLAAAADNSVFGDDEPGAAEIRAYWMQIATARAELTKSRSPRRRLARFLSLEGLLHRDERPVETSLRPTPDRTPSLRRLTFRPSERLPVRPQGGPA